jgi:hypothetical protein
MINKILMVKNRIKKQKRKQRERKNKKILKIRFRLKLKPINLKSNFRNKSKMRIWMIVTINQRKKFMRNQKILHIGQNLKNGILSD